MDKLMRALIIGRFQPFHKGHMLLVEHIFEECNEIIIAIASAQFNYLPKDPFTAGERVEMIARALKDKLSRCFIIPIINDENNARWFMHLKSYLPAFDIVYTGNEYVKMLLKPYVKVKDATLYDKERYNGSKIRELMINGKEWRDLVPKEVANFIDIIDGVNRLKIIAKADSRPQEW